MEAGVFGNDMGTNIGQGGLLECTVFCLLCGGGESAAFFWKMGIKRCEFSACEKQRKGLETGMRMLCLANSGSLPGGTFFIQLTFLRTCLQVWPVTIETSKLSHNRS